MESRIFLFRQLRETFGAGLVGTRVVFMCEKYTLYKNTIPIIASIHLTNRCGEFDKTLVKMIPDRNFIYRPLGIKYLDRRQNYLAVYFLN